MRLGLIAVALVSSSVGAYAAHTYGYSRNIVFVAGVAAFVIGWLLAWVLAVYFLHRPSSQEIYPKTCPACGQYIGGSFGWMVNCSECGWKPGKPLLRWFTHSAPAVWLGRVVRSPGLVLGVLAVSGLFFMLISGAAPEDLGQKEDVEVVSNQGDDNEFPDD